MINPEKQLDEHFHDKLDGLEINPPDRVWAGIANNLDKAQLASEKRKMGWLLWLSAVSLVVSLGTITVISLKDDTTIASKQENVAEPVNTGSMTGKSTVNNTSPIAENKANSSNGTSYTNSNSYTSTPSVTTSSKITVTPSKNKKPIAAAPGKPAETQEPQEEQQYIARTPVRHVDLAKVEAPKPEKQYKIYVPPTASEIVMTSNKIEQVSVETRGLASELQPFDDIDIIPGRVVCPKWKVGVNYTYAWTTFRDLKDSKDSVAYYSGSSAYLEKHRLTSDHFDSIETKKKGFSKGISLSYRVLPHFTIKTGVDLTRYQWDAKVADAVLVKNENDENVFAVTSSTSNYTTDSINGHAATDFLSIWGFTPTPQAPDTVLVQHRFNYVSIPLSVSYNVFDPCRKLGVSLNAGVAASFLKSYTITHNGEEKKHDAHYMKSRSMELVAGAAISYDPVRNLSIEVQPVYRRFIQPVNRYQTVKTYPYMWGLQGGVYFKF